MLSFLKIKQAARSWDKTSGPENTDFNWWDVSEIVKSYNAKICGEPVAGDNAAGCRLRFKQRWPDRRFDRAVSIGCGVGIKELAMVKEGIVDHFSLFDISQESMARARQNFEESSLGDRVTCLESDPVADTSSRFDLVYWDHALHHMFNVERYVAWSKSALLADGVVVLNDYVGPNRLQWTKYNIQVCRKLVEDVVDQSTRAKLRPIENTNWLSRLKCYLEDPSEACESEKIISTVRKYFPQHELRVIGGFIYLVLGNRLKILSDNPEVIKAIVDCDEAMRNEHYHYAFMLGDVAPFV